MRFRGILGIVMGAALAVGPGAGPARAAEKELCNTGEPGFVDAGFAVQANRWNSTGEICVTHDTGSSFTVSKSTLSWSNLTNGAPPGAYPNIGTTFEDQRLPRSLYAPGTVLTTWDVNAVSGAYNASYDLWYHPDAQACKSTSPYIVANGQALEIMIWLTSPGIDPAPDWKIADNVQIGDRAYDLFKFTGPTGQTGLIYNMRTETTNITEFDLTHFGRDAANRGFQSHEAQLCKVQAGFEITEGAVGLRTNDFAFKTTDQATPTPTQTPTPSATATPTPVAKEREDDSAGPWVFVLPAIAGIGAVGGLGYLLRRRRP